MEFQDKALRCVTCGAEFVWTAGEQAFFAEKLPYFAIPRYVEVLPELPKNATLRVMKHLLRERGVTSGTWDLEAMGFAITREERR